MDEVESMGMNRETTRNSGYSALETTFQYRQPAAQLVCQAVLILSILVLGLCLLFAVFSSWQLWGGSVIASAIFASAATFSWWLVQSGNSILGARINIVTLALVVAVMYWLTPYFALYLVFLFIVTIVHIVLGLKEAFAVGGFMFLNSLLYLLINNNRMFAPDGQVVMVDYGTFLIWWTLIGGIVWMVSFLYQTVQRDNQTLNLQTLELKKSQQHLQESKERYRALSQASFEGIVLHDQGIVLEANQTLAEMLGYTPAELTGKALIDLVKPVQEAQAKQLDLGNCQTEGVGIRKDGSHFPVECQSRDFIFRERLVKVCAIRDITNRKQTEEALRFSQQELLQAQKMESIGRLAGGIAHDFNNLLSVILGECNLLLDDIAHEHAHYLPIQDIQLAAERATNLTRQLLAFSRKQKLEPQVVNLNEIVFDMDNLLRRLIRGNIQLNLQLEPELAEIKIDPGQFEQVVMNLAINASDAMLGGGVLSIETANVYLQEDSFLHLPNLSVTKGDYVLLTVSDNGIGMDSETQAQIFEPFFTTKETGKGTGLGLAITFGVVKQSGGYILVDSTFGKGTIFRIYLPTHRK